MKTAEELLSEKGKMIYSTSPDATIKEAVKIMLQNNIGAILVEEDSRMVGIWTERDLLHDMMNESFDFNTSKVKDFMTKDPISAPHDETALGLMDRFLGKRCRHLLITKDNKNIGVLTTGDVMKDELNTKTAELEKLHAMVSWEYYSNWRWVKK